MEHYKQRAYKPSGKHYTTIPSGTPGLDAIKILEGYYSGMVFTFGRVSLEENENKDGLKISFNYDIIDNGGVWDYDEEDFKVFIANILEDELYSGLEFNNITYYNGTDDKKAAGRSRLATIWKKVLKMLSFQT